MNFRERQDLDRHITGNWGEDSVGDDADEQPETIQQRLEYLRGELRAERISYGELAELQSLVEHIAPDDVELLEAAGVPEQQPASQQPAGERPIPWTYQPHGLRAFDQYLVSDDNGYPVAIFYDAEPCAVAVRAVNEREELLAAIRGLLQAYAGDADKTVALEGETALHSSVARARAALHRAEQEGE